VRVVHVTNDPMPDVQKHYVTVIMAAEMKEDSAELQNMEPHKCESWRWVPWEQVIAMRNSPEPSLFIPLINFVDDMKNQKHFMNNHCGPDFIYQS
jgi:hypothetical protein